MLELLTTCPRALQYNKLNQRISAAEKPALNFGSAIHLALEYRYQTYRNISPDLVFDNEVAQLLSSFFDDHPCPIEDWRNLNWALELLKRYNNKYSVEEFSLLKHKEPVKCHHCEGRGFLLEIPEHKIGTGLAQGNCLWCKGTGNLEMMVELPFALELYTFWPRGGDNTFSSTGHSIKVLYCGKIDLPVILDGNLFVVDHKTTSMLGQQFFDKMRMSAQQKGYCWAMQQTTGLKPFGYMINGIRSKEPPIWVKEGGESNRKRQQTVETWFDESLQRERFYLKDGELDEWKNNTIALIDEFFWHYSRGYMPMKTSWCSQFGRCPYYDVCTLPVQDREATLMSGFFTNNTWSPLQTPSQSKQ